jgi:hypothetical protein
MIQIVSTTRRIALAALCCSGLCAAAPKVFDVNCTRRDNIADALERADPGDAIRITGTCYEKITIRTDRVTLVGSGGAVIQGGMTPQGVELDGLVTVDGARGVVIRNLTIQRSRAEGVFATHGAAFTLENVTLQDNAGSGVGSSSSLIEVTNCTSRRNVAGFDLFNGTQVVFRGNIAANDNQTSGIFMGGTSSFEVRGARVEANNNTSGIVVNGKSHVGFWTFNGTQTRGGAITVAGNRGPGVALVDGTMGIYSEATRVTARNNAVGISVAGPGGLASPFPGQGVQILLENNSIGLDLGQGGTAVIIGGLSVRNNTTAGIAADNASLTLVSVPPNPSVVSSNAIDLTHVLERASRWTAWHSLRKSVNRRSSPEACRPVHNDRCRIRSGPKASTRTHRPSAGSLDSMSGSNE